MKTYELPQLPVDYSALGPRISGRSTEPHRGNERTLAFNLSGHILHSVFWAAR